MQPTSSWLEGVKCGPTATLGVKLLGVCAFRGQLLALTPTDQVLLAPPSHVLWSQALPAARADSIVRLGEEEGLFGVATKEPDKPIKLSIFLAQESGTEPIFTQEYVTLLDFELKMNFLFVSCEFGVQVWLLPVHSEGSGQPVKFATIATPITYLFETGMSADTFASIHFEPTYGVLTVVAQSGFSGIQTGYWVTMFLLHNIPLGPFRTFKIKMTHPPTKFVLTSDLSTLIFLTKTSKILFFDAYTGQPFKKFTKRLGVHSPLDFCFCPRNHMLVLASPHNLQLFSQRRQFEIVQAISYPAVLSPTSRIHLRLSEEDRSVLVEFETGVYTFRQPT